MKKSLYWILTAAFISLYFTPPSGTGYQVGDVVADFSGKDVTGKMISTKDFPKAKGYVIVFTCNTCPYAKLYEDRIISLAKKLDDASWPLIAINSNDRNMSPGDSYDKMQERSRSKAFPFPYVHDESQSIVQAFGASKTPHFYILDAAKKVKYIGAMDDNAEEEAGVKINYVQEAIKAIEKNQDPDPSFTRAIGCSIKKRTT